MDHSSVKASPIEFSPHLILCRAYLKEVDEHLRQIQRWTRAPEEAARIEEALALIGQAMDAITETRQRFETLLGASGLQA